MKTIGNMLVAAIAAAGMVATAQAQSHPASRGASASGGARIHTTGTHGSWGGGHWRGGGGHWGGARWGLYLGAPILWSSWYWAGYPYYYDYWYPRSTVIYDRVIERYPASYPEGTIGPAPTTDIGPRSEGAPSEAPAYRNYCESAKAYFPKVTACPEGWRFVPAR